MTMKRNLGCKLDLEWLKNVNINLMGVRNTIHNILVSRELQGEHRVAWLLKAITCIDLTTLNSDDTPSNVSRLCYKAARPLSDDLLTHFEFDYGPQSAIKTAAICVYPSKVKIVADIFRRMKMLDKINIASVATGFPSGQMPLNTRLQEIKYAIENGANEIDIVIDRSLVLTGQWELLYEEIQKMKEVCGTEVHMKAILATGELGTLNNVYKASLVAMMAGADFVKTSTGKEAINATLTFGVVMMRAINDYYEKTGIKIGLKPAGGIRTSDDAISWLILVKELLGNEWLNPELFRFGASGLLGDIEYNLLKFSSGHYPASYEVSSGNR